MVDERRCDFCDRHPNESERLDPGRPALELDADNLWVCQECGRRIVTAPVGELAHGELPPELQKLVGQSVGAICLTLNLPHVHPYRPLIDHADVLHNRLMSAWFFVTQWMDGTTVWRSEDGSALALYRPDGILQIKTQ